MKKITLLSTLLFIAALFNLSATGIPGSGNSYRGAGLLSGQMPANTRFSLEVGTGFSTMPGGGSMSGSWVSPVLSYDVNEKFTISAGGTFSMNSYNNMSQSVVVTDGRTHLNQWNNDHSMFLSGSYLISDRLLFSGTVYSEQGVIPFPTLSGDNMRYSTRGMRMGMEYKITDNLSFGAEVGMQQGYNPYSPFSNSRQRSRPFNSLLW